jgi:hypothetical protein
LFLIVLFLFVSTAHEKSIQVNTIDSSSGIDVPASIHFVTTVHNDTLESYGTLQTTTHDSQAKVKIIAQNYEPIEFDLNLSKKPNHFVTVSMRKLATISGQIRNGATDKAISDIKVVLERDGQKFEGTSDMDGYYSVSLPAGFYNLATQSSIHESYKCDYLFSPGEEMSEQIHLLPKDKTKISFSEYKSYSFKGTRMGHVAGYSQGINAVIKKNADGTYRIWQDFGANSLKGTCTIYGNDEKAWLSENDTVTELPHEAVYANRLLIKANEDFMNLLNGLRSNPDVKTTLLGVEAVNGVDCDKIRLVKDSKANWKGFYDCDATLWIMKAGKLSGMPTRMQGNISGRDEHFFYFDIDFDCSVTDVGETFAIPELERK